MPSKGQNLSTNSTFKFIFEPASGRALRARPKHRHTYSHSLMTPSRYPRPSQHLEMSSMTPNCSPMGSWGTSVFQNAHEKR